MKKIPTLFERVYRDHKVIGITSNITPGMEWVLDGEGIATLKLDGSCCCILNGEFYKRYDAKRGKKPPAGAIPCGAEDSITGHWPHWVKVDPWNKADTWFVCAYQNSILMSDGTYEAIGPHFQGNPYRLPKDILVRHGLIELFVPRTFEGIRDYLKRHCIEGIVFWKNDEPKCKIKRSDFGFQWPPRDEKKDLEVMEGKEC